MKFGLTAADYASLLSPQDKERLAIILDQYLTKVEQGDEPNLTQWCREHGDLAPAIRHYVQSLRFLKDAVGESESQSTRNNEPIDAPDKQIGDYKIVREIGRGGMGVVYEAHQISLGRRVALKLLPFAAVLDQRQITRFQNEAQAAAQLHHPHIVPVYAIGSDRGTYFYSMQFIDGDSLEHVIAGLQSGCNSWPPASNVPNRPSVIGCDRNGTTMDADLMRLDASLSEEALHPEMRLSSNGAAATESNKRLATHVSARSRNHVRRIAELGVQAADAIHYANQNGIVHRDIKPSNLLIDREGKLWIADFGLAQCVGLGNLTRSGDVLGTLRYMSPEQAAGKTHWIDNRTDIYSLGLTLYELLTLSPAILGNDRMAMLRQIESEQPTAPRRLNPSVPVDLENIVLKAISKEREDRYATAGELAADLQRWLDGKTTMARRPSYVDLASRWVSKNARVVTIGLAVLLILFSIASVTASLFRAKNRAIEAANNLAVQHLRDANEVVDRFGAQLLTKLEWLPGTEELQQEVAQNSIDYLNAFADYASHDPNQRTAVSLALFKLAKLQELQGADLDAINTYRRAIESMTDLGFKHGDGRDLSDDIFTCRNNIACLLMRVGHLDEAVDGFHESLQWVDRISPKSSSQESKRSLRQALLRLNLGHLYRERGEERFAAREFEAAWTQLHKVGARLDEAAIGLEADLQQMLVTALLQVASGDANNGDAHDGDAHDGDAKDNDVGMLNVALALAQATAIASGDSIAAQHGVCVCQLALGACMSKRGDIQKAKGWFERAANGLHRLAERSPTAVRLLSDEASALNNLGQAELALGDTLAAMQAFVSSRKILEALAANMSDYAIRSNLGGILHNQAIVEESNGNLESALSLINQAISQQSLALQVAPNCKRCQTFLAKHQSLLLQVSDKNLSTTVNVSPLTNDERTHEKF